MAKRSLFFCEYKFVKKCHQQCKYMKEWLEVFKGIIYKWGNLPLHKHCCFPWDLDDCKDIQNIKLDRCTCVYSQCVSKDF